MSKIKDNKHYTTQHAYHVLNVNGLNNKIDSLGVINVKRDDSLYDETHLASVVISPLVPDSTIVDHAVAREGRFNFYNNHTNDNSAVKINSEPAHPNKSCINIVTTKYTRPIYSSKLVVAGEVIEQDTGPSQIWIG